MERQWEASSDDHTSAAGDEQLTLFVAALHDALLNGQPTAEIESHVGTADAASQVELRRAQRVLKGLTRAKQIFDASQVSESRGKGPLSWAEFRQTGETDVAGPALERLGRFAIERQLGHGGLGVVFLAYDAVLRRRVALKVPRPEALLTAEIRARFEREAQAAARLTHPNLVPVYEVGQAGPVTYIASAWCDGPNLATWLRERGQPVEPRWAAELVQQLAEAVDYAHSQGVLHRDLKPSNVLLVPMPAAVDKDSSHGSTSLLNFTPKLVDFGLARIADQRGHETRTGIVIGTPGYMAPEQAEGHTAEIGPATDVYGLGAMLYELLVGNAPFGATSDVDALRRIVTDEPRPPRSVAPNTPADLEAICLKCLEKRPEARYASAAELAADLGRYLRSEPTRARPLKPWAKAWRWIKRRPYAAALSFVLLASAGALSTVGWLYANTLSRSLAREQELVNDLTVQSWRLRTTAFPAAISMAQALLNAGDQQAAAAVLADFTPPQYGVGTTFAWRYLNALSNRKQRIWTGHRGAVYGVAYSPDGKLLASAGQDKTVRLWDGQRGAVLHTFSGHANEVNAVCFTPDGRWLYSVDDDGELRCWDATLKEPLGVLAKLPGRGWNLVMSSDGSRLWCIVNPNETQVHHIVAWEIGRQGDIRSLLEIDQLGPNVSAMALLDKDRALCVSPYVSEVTVVSVNSEKLRTSLIKGILPMSLAGPNADGDLVFGDKSGRVGVLRPPYLQIERSWSGHTLEVGAVIADYDGDLAASAGNDGLVRLWDVDTGGLLDTLATGQDRLWSLTASPTRASGNVVAAGSNGDLISWELQDPGQCCWEQRRLTMDNRIYSLAISPDGKGLAIVRGDADQKGAGAFTLEMRRLCDGALLSSRQSAGEDVQWSATGSMVATESSTGKVTTWDIYAPTAKGSISVSIDKERAGMHGEKHLAWAPGRDEVIVTPIHGEMQRIDARSGAVIARLKEPAPTVPVAVFAPPFGETILGAPERSLIQLYAVTTLEPVGKVSFPSIVSGLNCSTRGANLAAFSGRVVFVSEIPTGQLRQRIVIDSLVRQAEFSPSNDVIVLSCQDGSLRFHDIATGQELIRLPGFVDNCSLRFAPDGKAFHIAAFKDRKLRLRSWRLPE